MILAIVVFVAGVLCLALGSISFRVRAIANKPAWGGATKPLLLAGILIFAAGLALLYFAMRQRQNV